VRGGKGRREDISFLLPSVIALCGRNPAGLRLYEAQGKAFQNGQAN